MTDIDTFAELDVASAAWDIVFQYHGRPSGSFAADEYLAGLEAARGYVCTAPLDTCRIIHMLTRMTQTSSELCMVVVRTSSRIRLLIDPEVDAVACRKLCSRGSFQYISPTSACDIGTEDPICTRSSVTSSMPTG